MNVVPLFSDRQEAMDLWRNSVHWWIDPSIKIRFVEIGDSYWFVMGSESQKPDSNMSFFKMLPKSENYERFKKGHGGEAYLRLGIYSEQDLSHAKKDAICNCGHTADDHDEGDDDVCLYNTCECKKFSGFQVNLLKKKKTVTDILFLDEKDVKEDSLAWNCLYVNKYSKTE